MMKKSPIILLLLISALTGCHSLDKYSWSGAQLLRGAGGDFKIDDDVEIWSEGEPSEYYVPIEIAEASARETPGVQAYLFGVLKKQTKAVNGDGFILLSNGAAAGGAAPAGSTYGSLNQNNASLTSTTMDMPVKYSTYQAMIFRYATDEEIRAFLNDGATESEGADVE